MKQFDLEYNLFKCVTILNSCSDEYAMLLYGMYIKDINRENLALEHGFSKKGMYRLIDKELSKLFWHSVPA